MLLKKTEIGVFYIYIDYFTIIVFVAVSASLLSALFSSDRNSFLSQYNGVIWLSTAELGDNNSNNLYFHLQYLHIEKYTPYILY